MRKLLVAFAVAACAFSTPRTAAARVDVSIGIGLPFPQVFVAPRPPVVYAPQIVYPPPVFYGPPPVVYARPSRVIVVKHPGRWGRRYHHPHYRY